MISVGIIANPAAGHDIRRLTTQASVVGNDEKARMVRRALIGLAAAGVERAWLMPDEYGIGLRALDGPPLRLAAELVPMTPRFDEEDSRQAARWLAATGATCLLTLGGDGTNRAVAGGCGAVPLLPISTGTNNAFPLMIEATVAGLAAGLVARGLADTAVGPTPRVEIFHRANADGPEPPGLEAEPDEIALVDAAIYDDWQIGARAVLDTRRVRALVLARAEPGSIGLAAIGAALPGGPPPPGHGLALWLGPGGRQVWAPLSPGLVEPVPIVESRRLAPGEALRLQPEHPWVLVLDGERSLVRPAGAGLWLRVTLHGPRLVDPRRALALAAGAGFFEADAAQETRR